MALEITCDILHCEEVVNESPLFTDAQNPYNSMQRIFVEVNYPYEHSAFSWVHVGLMLQMFIYVDLVLHLLIQLRGLIHGDKNAHSAHLGEDQNKIFDTRIKEIVV